jgi:hypothetical protein
MSEEILSLNGKTVGYYTLHVDGIKPGRFDEETNFELYLKNKDGKQSESPVTYGKHFAGRGEHYRPWIEVHYERYVVFGSSRKLDLAGNSDIELFQVISDLLPPGSHIMVAYSNHPETKRALELGVPAPATYIGYLLFQAGCTSFKDWYFAEGFREGDIKLQGNKPVDKKKRDIDIAALKKELTSFLREEPMFHLEREMAKIILGKS